MSIKKINQFPDGNGNLTNDDLFIFMDDPSGSGVTKKISLSQLGSAIGGGGGSGADTGDITFSGVQIIGAGEGSGDGNGYGTIELVPDSGRYTQNQYIIIDPTAPDHIHIRAGGNQDGSNAELILGGEHANVRVVDNGHQVNVRTAAGGLTTIYFSTHCSSEPGLYTVSDGVSNTNPLPQGTTFVYNNVQYSIETTSFDSECQNGYFFTIVPALLELPGTVEANIPLSDKNWTFGNDGVLDLASGGLRFADNSVQDTAGVVSTDPSVASFIKVNNIVTLSQADYDNLTPDSNTVYLIIEAP